MKAGFIRKKCPKCGGSLYLDRDYYIEGGFISWYEQVNCLQCGFNFGMKMPQQATVTVAATDKAMPAMKHLVVV